MVGESMPEEVVAGRDLLLQVEQNTPARVDARSHPKNDAGILVAY
jgi:hypothetical protein